MQSAKFKGLNLHSPVAIGVHFELCTLQFALKRFRRDLVLSHWVAADVFH